MFIAFFLKNRALAAVSARSWNLLFKGDLCYSHVFIAFFTLGRLIFEESSFFKGVSKKGLKSRFQDLSKKRPLGRPGDPLESPWGAPWSPLGLLGDALGPLWAPLGSFWGAFGCLLGHFGSLWGAFGCLLGPFGSF